MLQQGRNTFDLGSDRRESYYQTNQELSMLRREKHVGDPPGSATTTEDSGTFGAIGILPKRTLIDRMGY